MYKNNISNDTLDAINQILPQIQNQICQKLRQQMQQQFKQKLLKNIQQTQQLAYKQYQQALLSLKQQADKLEQQKLQILENQLIQIQQQYIIRQKQQFIILQDKFITNNFNQKILKHYRILQIEKQIEQQICLQYQQKHTIAKDRKIKQIQVKLQQKQQKIRKDKDKIIKNQQYQDKGIQGLKNDIQLLRVGIASMKSQYNIKIRKIDQQIKNNKIKIKQLSNHQQNIQQLQKKLKELKQKKQIQLKKKQQSQSSINKYSQRLSLLNSFNTHTMINDQEIRYCNEDVVIQSSNQDNDDRDWRNNMMQLILPPPSCPNISCSSQSFNRDSILDLDVCALLRQKWQADPLQKYLAKQNHSIENRQVNNQSRFQQQYEVYLKRLGYQKGRKLSNQAKKAIMSNLISYKFR